MEELEKLEDIYYNISKISDNNLQAVIDLIEITEDNVMNNVLDKQEGSTEFMKYLQYFKKNLQRAEERYKKLSKSNKNVSTLNSRIKRLFGKHEERKPHEKLLALRYGLTFDEVSNTHRR